MKKLITAIKKNLFIFLTLSSIVLTVPTQALAQPTAWSGRCIEKEVATIQGLECLIGNVFTVIITLIGFSGFVMFIIASFRWLLSGGNTKGIETAKNTMTFAVVGIVLSLSAFIILNIIAEFTGVENILLFTIPGTDM